MSEPVAIMTSDVIRPEEFIAFLSEAGARITGENAGQICRGKPFDSDQQNVWIAIDNTIHKSVKDESECFDEWKMILHKLGAEPKTSIVMEVDSTSGSAELAIEFACAFSARWPCVVDNLYDYVYSAEELRALCQADGSLG